MHEYHKYSDKDPLQQRTHQQNQQQIIVAPEFCVYFPVGNIGIELEAAEHIVDSGGRRTLMGCRVRGWKSASKSSLALKVTQGCRVVSVDDEVVAELPFSEIIGRIRGSVRRKITWAPLAQAGGGQSSSPTAKTASLGGVVNTAATARKADHPGKENKQTQHQQPSTDVKGKQSPAHLLRRMQDEDIPLPAPSSKALEYKSPEKSRYIEEGRQRMLSPVVIASRSAASASAQVARLEAECAAQAREVAALRGSVLELKRQAKSSAGEMVLSRFKLQRTRSKLEERDKAASSTADSDEVALVPLCLLKHWRRYQSVLAELQEKSCEGDFQPRGPHITECEGRGGKSLCETQGAGALHEQLAIQTALNKRLETQLRDWVEQTIEQHRAGATHEVLAQRTSQPKPKHAETQQRHSFIARTATVDKRRDPAEERSIWMSARKSVYGLHSPGPALSPASFREHMERLRSENYAVKDDILKFRLALKKLRDESRINNNAD